MKALPLVDKFYQLTADNKLKFDINSLQGGLFARYFFECLKRRSASNRKKTCISQPLEQELTMKINSLNQQTPPSIPTDAIKSTTVEENRSALQNQSTVTDNDGDSDSSGSGETVNFSKESLQLAKTSTVPNSSAQVPITDKQQAQQLVGQLLSNPEQMPAAFRQISPAHARSLMA